MFSESRSGAVSNRDAYVFGKTNKYPAVYSSDFGDVNTSNLAQRKNVVTNAGAYAERGSIIQLHYHMVQPDQPDGAGFDVMHGFTEQKPYAASNIDKMLTVGDPLNVELLKRIDEIAGYMKELQDKGVAVLWRPYHEMNGAWFWWGQQARFKDLWIQMWERFKSQGVNNVLWVFSVNYWASNSGTKYDPTQYYPGDAYVDVLGVDVYKVYGHAYETRVHDALTQLGSARPLAITENGEMPTLPKFHEEQPDFVYWATWFSFETPDASMGNNSDALYAANYSDPVTLTQDEVDVPACF